MHSVNKRLNHDYRSLLKSEGCQWPPPAWRAPRKEKAAPPWLNKTGMSGVNEGQELKLLVAVQSRTAVPQTSSEKRFSPARSEARRERQKLMEKIITLARVRHEISGLQWLAAAAHGCTIQTSSTFSRRGENPSHPCASAPKQPTNQQGRKSEVTWVQNVSPGLALVLR